MSLYENLRLAAVVVTYNRKQLLVECLRALLRQTVCIDRIFIINNASTDGTNEYLEEQGLLSYASINLENMNQNEGGAGGFYRGIKNAYDSGFDYVFLMDDDGYPAEDCLEKLLANRQANHCLGALVVDKDNPTRLAFPLRLSGSARVIDNVDEAVVQPVLTGVMVPFNGVLLDRDLIERFGYPRADYFIWGDDMEYIWRLQAANVTLCTITEALFYHPRQIELGTPMLWGTMRFNDSSSLLKLYCMGRNNSLNLRKYKGRLAFFIFVFKCLWFYSFTRPNMKKLKTVLIGVWHALRGDLSHHSTYLS